MINKKTKQKIVAFSLLTTILIGGIAVKKQNKTVVFGTTIHLTKEQSDKENPVFKHKKNDLADFFVDEELQTSPKYLIGEDDINELFDSPVTQQELYQIVDQNEKLDHNDKAKLKHYIDQLINEFPNLNLHIFKQAISLFSIQNVTREEMMLLNPGAGAYWIPEEHEIVVIESERQLLLHEFGHMLNILQFEMNGTTYIKKFGERAKFLQEGLNSIITKRIGGSDGYFTATIFAQFFIDMVGESKIFDLYFYGTADQIIDQLILKKYPDYQPNGELSGDKAQYFHQIVTLMDAIDQQHQQIMKGEPTPEDLKMSISMQMLDLYIDQMALQLENGIIDYDSFVDICYQFEKKLEEAELLENKTLLRTKLVTKKNQYCNQYAQRHHISQNMLANFREREIATHWTQSWSILKEPTGKLQIHRTSQFGTYTNQTTKIELDHLIVTMMQDRYSNELTLAVSSLENPQQDMITGTSISKKQTILNVISLREYLNRIDSIWQNSESSYVLSNDIFDPCQIIFPFLNSSEVEQMSNVQIIHDGYAVQLNGEELIVSPQIYGQVGDSSTVMNSSFKASDLTILIDQSGHVHVVPYYDGLDTIQKNQYVDLTLGVRLNEANVVSMAIPVESYIYNVIMAHNISDEVLKSSYTFGNHLFFLENIEFFQTEIQPQKIK